MSAIVISGDTSGSITLNAPAVAGTTVLTLPTQSGTLSIGGGNLIGYQVFTATGNYTKATNNPSFVIVEVQGGGSGGRGISSSIFADGGTSGGYSKKLILASSLSASETVTIGAGGAGSAPLANAGVGGTSSFGAHCSATGGSAPASGVATAGLGSGGDINVRGNNSSKNDGFGAGSPMFGGGALTPTASGQAGVAAVANSGGGGGGALGSGTTSYNGGTGGSGIVIVWEYK